MSSNSRSRRRKPSTCGDSTAAPPGPTIQVTQGDKIRVIFKNELPESSSIHWHGFEDQIGYDGMPGISQAPLKPGETFVYHFTIKQEGTFFYHSHMAMQEMAGMLGAFIMHPKVPYRPPLRQGLCYQPAGVLGAPQQHHPQHHEHGVQLAPAQRQGRPRPPRPSSFARATACASASSTSA